ncbi:MAG: dimethylargininase [Planctomycetes bacterium]|nr:dimethylargininase [Planctomycetota bacterium]
MIAVTRRPDAGLYRCQLTHIDRAPIDIDRAIQQHTEYERRLFEAGYELDSLPADPRFPDGLFVEDTAIVLPELAVIARPAPLLRRGEVERIAERLANYRPCFGLDPDAFLEGGDVLRVGRTLYAGCSQRSNAAGIASLRRIVEPIGYSVVPVRVDGCLHLKTACTALDEQTLLANCSWIDAAAFHGLQIVPVPEQEPWGANVLRLKLAILASDSYPRTLDLIASLGFAPLPVAASEFHKAEAGLTCLSLLLDS